MSRSLAEKYVERQLIAKCEQIAREFGSAAAVVYLDSLVQALDIQPGAELPPLPEYVRQMSEDDFKKFIEIIQ